MKAEYQCNTVDIIVLARETKLATLYQCLLITQKRTIVINFCLPGCLFFQDIGPHL